MVIGSDFDGVIADTFALTEKGVSLEAILSGDVDVRLIPPMSKGMVELLNNNNIAVIITARDLLHPVSHWLDHHAPEYKGAIHSSNEWNNSKALGCQAHSIDLFIDDDPVWIDEINNAGIQALHFVRELHADPAELLEVAAR